MEAYLHFGVLVAVFAFHKTQGFRFTFKAVYGLHFPVFKFHSSIYMVPLRLQQERRCLS